MFNRGRALKGGEGRARWRRVPELLRGAMEAEPRARAREREEEEERGGGEKKEKPAADDHQRVVTSRIRSDRARC